MEVPLWVAQGLRESQISHATSACPNGVNSDWYGEKNSTCRFQHPPCAALMVLQELACKDPKTVSESVDSCDAQSCSTSNHKAIHSYNLPEDQKDDLELVKEAVSIVFLAIFEQQDIFRTLGPQNQDRT